MTFQVLIIDPVHDSMLNLFAQTGWNCTLAYDWSEDEIRAQVGKYDGLAIRSRFRIDASFIDQAQKLQFIARPGAGLENIDRTYAESKGIRVFNSPEGNRDAVGEQAVGMLLMLLNNLRQADAEVRQGIWQREKNRGTELKEKTVGIIGYGNMGGAFASRIKGFGVNILAYDKYKSGFSDEFVTECSLGELFEQAEVVSLHTPLTKETRFMVNADFLSRFANPIYFINTARGQSVKTSDLVEALQSGQVLGACLDVLEYEGVSFEALSKTDLPPEFAYLTQSDRVILSPHIAGWTHASNRKMSELLAQKVVKAFG